MRRAVAAMLLLLGLAGCVRSPPSDQLQQDIIGQLTSAFGPGAFDVVSISRRGSSADIASPPGENRRIVYYDATLRLARELDFGGWNTPGIASLVTAFGAGPRGITGARAGGNKAGDEIRAHGTAIYRRDGETWRPVAPPGFSPAVAPAIDAISPPSASDRLLAALQSAVRAIPAGIAPAAQAVIDQELSHALATIQARLTRLSQGYPIAAGQEGGQYVRFVQALQASKPMGLSFQALLTDGSIENLNLLRQEKVLLAIAQGDIARQALSGGGPFVTQGPFTALRALGSLYPEPLHILVRADSPAKTVRDLSHKRLGLGPAGSGTRATAERLLDAYGMRRDIDYDLDEAPLSSAIGALESGQLDAVLQVIGLPADQIRAALATVPLRLLPVDEAVLSNLAEKDPAILRGLIPRGTYHGIEHDVPTLTVAALLTTTSSLSESEARSLSAAIFGNKADLLAAGSAQAGQVSAATARIGIPIPLAGGAEAALSDLNEGKK